MKVTEIVERLDKVLKDLNDKQKNYHLDSKLDNSDERNDCLYFELQAIDNIRTDLLSREAGEVV